MTDTDRIGDWVLANTHQYVAFNKPAGLPVQPDPSGDLSLLSLGEIYTRTKLFLVHRIDRPTSGVVLLAKKKPALAQLNEQFSQGNVRKVYLAVVGGTPPAAEGELVHYLRRDGRTRRTAIFEEPTEGAQEARLIYRHRASGDRYHLLEVELHSGRFHQIRAQLAHIGCPVRGDEKYGFKRANPGGGIDLHAWQLHFDHPVTGERVELTAPVPDTAVWNALMPLM